MLAVAALLYAASITLAAVSGDESAAGVAPVDAPAPMTARTDWHGVEFYREANRHLPPPHPGVPRVVFIGDSITASWDLAVAAAPGTEVVNRGISGQTTAQMLLRFREDVIALSPAAVHIMAGINDLAENAGPTTLEAIEHNLASMVELARARQIRVVLGSVSPALDFPWRRGLQPAAKIAALNTWLRAYSGHRHVVYVDYYRELADARGAFRSDLSDDGVHPNRAGYAVMQPLARRAIARSLRRVAK